MNFQPVASKSYCTLGSETIVTKDCCFPGELSLAIPSWVGAMSTSQGDSLQLGSKGRYGTCVGGR